MNRLSKLGFIAPATLSIFFVLSLYSRNIAITSFDKVWRPLVISIVVTLGIYYICYFICKSTTKANILLIALVIATFGYSYSWIITVVALAAFLATALTKNRYLPTTTVLATTVIAGCLLITPLFTITSYHLNRPAPPSQHNGSIVANSTYNLSSKPNIYYIIPDSYAGKWTLEELGYDNSEFIGFLEDKGFYIAQDAYCNYPRTYLSLSATLNMEYLLSTDYEYNSNEIRGLNGHPTAVVAYLKSRDYQYVHVGNSMWEPTYDNGYADETYLYEKEGKRICCRDFELALLNIPEGREKARQLARESTLFQLNTLKTLPNYSQPTFVFCHLLIPHHNFYMFNADGSYPTREEVASVDWHDFYVGQIEYLNRQLEEIVTVILGKSSRPTIIVIQSDEGFSSSQYFEHLWARDYTSIYTNTHILKERAYILNAYYLPEGFDSLYSDISPVNTFRVIFNEHLDGDFELLPDKFYFAKKISEPGESILFDELYDATSEILMGGE